MYVDAQGLFSDAQALTATATSTNLIDLGTDGNLGIGEPMAVVVTLDVAADNTTTDETYSFAIEFDDNEAFSSATVAASKTIVAGAAAGTKYVLGVPAEDAGERYMRVNYTLGGTTPTVTVTTFLIPQSMIQNVVNYADGVTIS